MGRWELFSSLIEVQLLPRETYLRSNTDLVFPLPPFLFPACYAGPSYQDLGAVSREGLELPPGPPRTSAGAQESDASPAPPKKAFATSVLLGVSSEEPGAYKFPLKRELIIPLVRMDLKRQPELIVPLVPVDHQGTSMALPQRHSCTSAEQHTPAYSLSGRERVCTLAFQTGPGK